MVHVRTFDSFEEMQQAITDGLAFGNRNLHPAQLDLTFGSYFVQFPDVADRHVVFGCVLTRLQARAGSIAGGATEAEADAEDEALVAAEQDGMLFSRSFDRYETKGELGSIHRFNAWPIDRDLFVDAMDVGFDIDALPLDSQIKLSIAYRGFRSHHIEVAQRGDQP